ncbi:SDR family oxidoreductase [Ornithinimicrobium sufpigmenti]|uniref:SDR family oxidoreductase n=1 Tax=Ornithinimicrobium sufpigmenti TaxID=2508882 RepID=UPI0010369C6A|nr:MULTISPECIES: SDR family oxidoreductase [unclassified Ornithinimicrobium]
MSASSRGLAVVTGASAGVGAAVATRLHASGHPLLLLSRRKEPMAALGLERAELAAVDIKDTDAVSSALEAATARFGPVETLVHNAGVMSLGGIVDQPLDEWRSTIEVNLLAVVGLTRLVLPSMYQRQRGTILVISSLGARQVFENHAAYCASKAAVHSLCAALRLEAAPQGVRVVEVAPGMIRTNLVDSTSSDQLRSEYLARRAHVLEPEDVADVVGWAAELPAHVSVRELHVAHTHQQ